MKKVLRGFLYLLLAIYGVITIFPFAYMVAVAFTPDTYVLPYPPILFPEKFYIGNFIDALISNNFIRYFFNSAYVATISTVISLFASSLTAYGFARFRFKGREIIFKIFLFTLMVPGLINIVPQFLIIKSLNLVDTYSGLILLYIGGGIAGNTFFLRGFFEQIPLELEEAAIIDGASKWMIYGKVILPLAKPALGTLAIFVFTGYWDEFYAALTIIKTVGKRTLPIAIQLFRGQHASDWGLIFAASLIAVTPVIIIFLTFQKKFIKTGILEGSVKG